MLNWWCLRRQLLAVLAYPESPRQGPCWPVVRTNDERYSFGSIRAPRLLNARALKTVTKPPGVPRGEEFSQDTCKIWRKFEECAAIGYHHLLRIASNSPIQAHIRIGHALTPTKI